ncbi:MAG TPA: hypothetical protein VHM02_15975, partial [Thermoanaerobaculia bacterium]|nr:hypothetical protein [Thermoanaerobaculia bacterium]
GGPDDVYGGLGRNGALKTPEASMGPLQAVGGGYDFAACKVYNLLADRFVVNHGAVAVPETAYAILHAVAAAE